jgi:LemA protein
MFWVLIGVVILLVVLVVVGYNKLIALKGQTVNAWKQIDVQLKRRHDLIPNLVSAVKGAMEFEKDTLEAVIQARNQAVKVQANASPAGGVAALAQAEATLGAALSRLNVVVEQYPNLKATANVGQLQEELTSTENRVAFARQAYNDFATEYNVTQQQIPWNFIAPLAKAQPAELWEIEEAAERQAPKVDLSMKPRA